ncbi:hypothetical protein Actkin_02877 [Actinokineospora sp. UTMC 2448]|nr:hypothetical protein Actkin_02877 [Actinokineospora sp. UTMC 2448]
MNDEQARGLYSGPNCAYCSSSFWSVFERNPKAQPSLALIHGERGARQPRAPRSPHSKGHESRKLRILSLQAGRVNVLWERSHCR